MSTNDELEKYCQSASVVLLSSIKIYLSSIVDVLEKKMKIYQTIEFSQYSNSRSIGIVD